MRNFVSLIGKLGAEPELREFGKEGKLVKIGLATTEKYRNAKGELITDTTWHNLVIWGKQAETAAKFMKKGSEVAVQGKIVNSNYEDKSGVKRYITEIKVDEFILLGGKP